jgi:hypothetical protein
VTENGNDPPRPDASDFWDWFGRNGGLKGIAARLRQVGRFINVGDEPPPAQVRPGPKYRITHPSQIERAHERRTKRIGRPATENETAEELGVGLTTLTDALKRFGVAWPPPWHDNARRSPE